MERAAPTRRSAALALASPAVQRESGAWTECAAQRVYRMAGTALLTASAVAKSATIIAALRAARMAGPALLTASAVAKSATVIPAALRAARMAGPAPPTLSAVAETATVARAPLVHLVGSCSATAHARCLASVAQIALIAAALVLAAHPLTLVEPSAGGPESICVPPTAPVLLGRFVLVAAVLWRASGSAYQGLGAT